MAKFIAFDDDKTLVNADHISKLEVSPDGATHTKITLSNGHSFVVLLPVADALKKVQGEDKQKQDGDEEKQ